MKTTFTTSLLAACLVCAGMHSNVYAAREDSTCEYVNTDAGTMDFQFAEYVTNPAIFHKIVQFSSDGQTFELEDGSRWVSAKPDLMRGWEHTDRLVLTQNKATLSTYRYALVHLDLRLAVPVAIVREPQPGAKNTFYIKNIDTAKDLIVLSDGKQWVVHASDHNNIHKMKEHDRIEIGGNVGDGGNHTPYILIDTTTGHYVRASSYK